MVQSNTEDRGCSSSGRARGALHLCGAGAVPTREEAFATSWLVGQRSSGGLVQQQSGDGAKQQASRCWQLGCSHSKRRL